MKNLSHKFCFQPWRFLEIQNDLSVFNCCPNWVGFYSYGQLGPTFNIENIWNGERAKEFRQSILDGSFKYCNQTLCPSIQNDSLPNRKDVLDGKYGEKAAKIIKENQLESTAPTTIALSNDRSCNLQCPSCRSDFYYLNEKTGSAEFSIKNKAHEKLIDFLENCKEQTTVIVTGSGDPFASKLFFNLLTRLDGSKNPNLGINLQTNGLLFNQDNWDKLSKLHNNPISTIISLDAGTEETYCYTRKGGNWNVLMKNLDFVAQLYREKKLKGVRLDFVCQQKNYKEIKLFVDIAKKHSFKCYLSRIVDWGTYSPEEFARHNIFDPKHPEHFDFLKVINQDFEYDAIDFGNLSEFRKIKIPRPGASAQLTPEKSTHTTLL